MRSDGKAPTPPWLRGLDELEERVSRLEALASKPAPVAAPKKEEPKKEEPKKAAPLKKAAPKKAPVKKAPAKKK